MFLSYNVKLVMISRQANICDDNTTAYQVQKQEECRLDFSMKLTNLLYSDSYSWVKLSLLCELIR
jgi:hypothetical protein